MKVGLLSDIHGNADALKVVLDRARNEGVDELLIAGDFVGYYYHPELVLELLDDWVWTAVSGNHEAMLAQWSKGLNKTNILKKYGSGINIACKKLSTKQIEYLINLPSNRVLTVDSRTVLLCHGSPWDRDHYVYPDVNIDVHQRFFEKNKNLVVFGHTHYPVLWQQNSQIVVNPGSVGQPRDRISGACWALWDTEKHTVSMMRENYEMNLLINECKKIDPELPYLVNVLTRR